MGSLSLNSAWEAAKKNDLVDYLFALGHQPSKIQGNNYRYLSPLRTERCPSFKVDRRLNLWYDFGTGKGGTIIDFTSSFFGCSIGDALEKIGQLTPNEQPLFPVAAKPISPIEIHSKRKISSECLLHYLVQRKITPIVAAKYCVEVEFAMNNRTYVAIGFKNNYGGYELRNPWFKGSSAPKGITSFNYGSEKIAVFEGFFDFLSHQTIYKNKLPYQLDYLILNSLSFFEKSRSFMEYHPSIHLFLDRDKAGIEHTGKACGWSKNYQDESVLYKGYKDLNQWVQHIGKTNQGTVTRPL